jgi:hypothetical protein
VTWTKLGDEFAGESSALPDAAFRTHVEALLWSNHRLLDLLIPKRDVSRFAETDDPDTAVKTLVTAGWWEDRGDAYWIGCKFPHWQRDKVQVDNRRKQWAEDQRRSRRHRLDDHSLCLPTGKCRAVSATDSAPDPVSVSVSVSGRKDQPPTKRSNPDLGAAALCVEWVDSKSGLCSQPSTGRHGSRPFCAEHLAAREGAA